MFKDSDCYDSWTLHSEDGRSNRQHYFLVHSLPLENLKIFVFLSFTVASFRDKFCTVHVLLRIYLDILNEHQIRLDMSILWDHYSSSKCTAHIQSVSS